MTHDIRRNTGTWLLVLLLLCGCSQLPRWPFPGLGTTAAHRSNSPLLAGRNAATPARTKAQDAGVGLALARNQEMQGEIETAMRGYREVIARDDSQVVAYYRLARLHDQQGDCVKAWELYREALKRAPESPEICCDLGYNEYVQGHDKDAEQNLRKAIALRPDFPRAHNNLALVLARTGRIDEALSQFAQGGVREYDARANIALALMLDGQVEPAREQVTLAGQLEQPKQGTGNQLATLQRVVHQTETLQPTLHDVPPQPVMPTSYNGRR